MRLDLASLAAALDWEEGADLVLFPVLDCDVLGSSEEDFGLGSAWRRGLVVDT